MKDEIKEYLDSANFKFKDIDENGNEKELTLSEMIEDLIKNNKRLADYITNLQEELQYQKEAELEYNDKHTKLMKAYSNLQEENERLKEIVENLTTMTASGDGKQIKNTAQFKLDICKQRIDKATKELKKLLPLCIMPNNTLIHGTEKAKVIEKAINTLQGKSDK